MFCKKSPDGFKKLFLLALESSPGAAAYVFERYIFAGYEKLYEVLAGNAEQVRSDRIYLDVGAFEKLVNSSLVIRKAVNKNSPKSGQVSPFPHMFIRNETAPQKSVP